MFSRNGYQAAVWRYASTLVTLLFLTAVIIPQAGVGTLAAPTDPRTPGSGPAWCFSDCEPSERLLLSTQAEGSLIRALLIEPNSLDVPQTSNLEAFRTAWQLYDSLVWLDNDGWAMPALAQSWTISSDGTQYTFQLRQDVTFHNGEPFNADAVVFSWERASQGGFPRSNAWLKADSVVKTGDYTVVVNTASADGAFLRTVAQNWAMIPPVYFQSVGQAGFDAHPIGTGPFMFVEWIPGDHIAMAANASYWRAGLPKLQSITFRPIADPADRVTALLTGNADIVTGLTVDQISGLAGVDGIKLLSYPVDRVYYIAFNNLSTGIGQPTENAQVRQAMNYAVDVRTIIDTYFDGFGRESVGFVTPADFGYDNGRPFGYDPDKALALLAEAGYPSGFAMDMACPDNVYLQFEEVCARIVHDLALVGIDVNLQILDAGIFWDLEATKALPPLFGDSWGAQLGDPLPRLQGALGGAEEAYSAWYDPAIDALLDAIRVQTDQSERASLYRDLQQYMRVNPPFIYLYEPFVFEAIDATVQDYEPRLTGEYFLMDAWLDVDGDGVQITVEDGAPNGGDGNADGVPDRDQGNVASLPNVEDGRYLTLESPASTQLSAVQTLTNPSPIDAPPTATFPFGFVAFDVIGLTPGSSVAVTLTVPLHSEIDAYWRYGSTLEDPSEHWYRFMFDGTTGAEIAHDLDQTRILLHHVDGGRGDADLVADGQIIDPGGPAVMPPAMYLPLVVHGVAAP